MERNGKRAASVSWLAALIALGCVGPAAASVIVDEAGPDSVLEVGDELEAWRRQSAEPADPERPGGPISSPFTWRLVELEQAPRGPLTVTVARGGARIDVTLEHGRGGLEVRPALDQEQLLTCRHALAELTAAEPAGGVESVRAVAGRLADQPEVAAWVLRQAGVVLARSGQHALAAELLGHALATLSQTAQPGVRALLHEEIGQAHESQGDLEAAKGSYETALGLWRSGGTWPLSCARVLSRVADVARRGGDLDGAEKLYREALEILAPVALAGAGEAAVLGKLADTAVSRGDLDEAEERAESALAVARRCSACEAQVASSLNTLGAIARRRNDFDRARQHFEEALEIARRVAPDSATVITSLDGLGLIASTLGDLEAAKAFHQQGLQISKRLGSPLEVASSLANLGHVALDGGDLAAAGDLFGQAVEIRERLTPDSVELANTLNNMGIVTFYRGDLATAERCFRRTRDIRTTRSPGSLALADALNNLGGVAFRSGEVAAARLYFRESLEIRSRLAPGGLKEAASLNNLGTAALAMDDKDTAESYARRALELYEANAPASRRVAIALGNLSEIAYQRGDLEAAEGHARRALEIRNRVVPGSLEVAETLRTLGMILTDKSELDEAEELLVRALEIATVLAPGSTSEAQAAFFLARVARTTGRTGRALALFERAVDALEAQQGMLGTRERVSSFRSQYAHYYQEYLDLLIELGQGEQAFHILERSRARGMLALLGERELVFTADIPEELDRDRRQVAAEHDRLVARLARESVDGDPESRDALQIQLDTVRRRMDEIRESIRALAPRLAALADPVPLDLAGTRKALDSGVVLLAYSIGKERSHLFVVGREPDRFEVLTLAATEGGLRQRIRRLRNALQYSPGLDPILRMSRSLTTQLVAPAAEAIAGADRLLISADGPLHLLPFSVLLDPGTVPGDGFLVESRPLTMVASATVFAELQRQRRQRSAVRVVAFGDPSYTVKGGASEAGTGLLLRTGLRLDPLPATRSEVEALAGLYPDTEARLGPEATEENAKSLGRDVAIVHFACHGVIDEMQPLESGLALSAPGGSSPGLDNGVLQAWEVLESVRLDADLVTLSACETALGRELAGEGIVGLTRAFQYAGARAVLASLWSVADDSTAELMRRFYRRLRAGTPADQALRVAQQELIRGPVADPEGAEVNAAHPFFWAAFQLVGDWQ